MKAAESRPPRWQILLAFAIIYFVWGSTFLAIRVGVHEVPPLLLAAVSWSVASAFNSKVPLPESKPMSAAAQMLAGGAQLAILAALTGEFRGFHIQTVSFAAWFSLLYLTVAGSIIGFTAYVWLLHYESPTKVGTYAYVNPVVAVIVGYLLGGERVGPRTLLGTLLVLVSVITITTTPKAVRGDEKDAVAGAEMNPAEAE